LTLAKNPAIIKNMSNPEKKSSWLKQLIKRAPLAGADHRWVDAAGAWRGGPGVGLLSQHHE